MSDTIGIDIGVGSIKIAAIDKEGEQLYLSAIGESRTPQPGWLKEGPKSKNLVVVAKSIRGLMADMKLKAVKAVTAVPEDEVVSRLIRLPPLKESEIKDALRFEAETFVPYPLDQVSLDYEVIEQDSAGRLSVFAIASRNVVIESYVKLFRECGLELIALESPSISLRRCLKHNQGEQDSLLVLDMGEKYSDIVSLFKGNIFFTRAIPVGGESLTRAISINLGLDMPSAEEYKKAYGMKASELEGKIKSAIEPVFNSMAEEVRRAMVSFKEESGEGVKHLVLSGGGANMPGLAEELTRLLGIEVAVIQPLLKIDTKRLVMPFNVQNEACRFSLAIGLALRGYI